MCAAGFAKQHQPAFGKVEFGVDDAQQIGAQKAIARVATADDEFHVVQRAAAQPEFAHACQFGGKAAADAADEKARRQRLRGQPQFDRLGLWHEIEKRPAVEPQAGVLAIDLYRNAGAAALHRHRQLGNRVDLALAGIIGARGRGQTNDERQRTGEPEINFHDLEIAENWRSHQAIVERLLSLRWHLFGRTHKNDSHRPPTWPKCRHRASVRPRS